MATERERDNDLNASREKSLIRGVSKLFRFCPRVKMAEELFKNALEKSLSYPKPDVQFTYGTAGFRMSSDVLSSVMYRMGLLAVLRSRACGSKTIGLMITASHNPVQDNGVKLIDPLGEMLEAEWEGYSTELANTEDLEKCLRNLTEKVKTEKWNDVGNVAIARDTRPSGKDFAHTVTAGVEAFGGKHNDLGENWKTVYKRTVLIISALHN